VPFVAASTDERPLNMAGKRGRANGRRGTGKNCFGADGAGGSGRLLLSSDETVTFSPSRPREGVDIRRRPLWQWFEFLLTALNSSAHPAFLAASCTAGCSQMDSHARSSSSLRRQPGEPFACMKR
jgi:hypothetical protein